MAVVIIAVLFWLSLHPRNIPEDTYVRIEKSIVARHNHEDMHSASCLRCGQKDYEVAHTTMYSETEGCSALCEDCWSSLTPYSRMHYYIVLFHLWIDDEVKAGEMRTGTQVLRNIERAVLDGG